VQRATVVGGDDGDRVDPLDGAGAEDAQRDLAPVGHE
jgi:hypothetical protein